MRDRLHVSEVGEHAGELAADPHRERPGAGDLERPPLGLVDLEHRRRDGVAVLGREAELAPVDEPVPAGVHAGERSRVHGRVVAGRRRHETEPPSVTSGSDWSVTSGRRS